MPPTVMEGSISHPSTQAGMALETVLPWPDKLPEFVGECDLRAKQKQSCSLVPPRKLSNLVDTDTASRTKSISCP